jgi:flagellar hook-associated protein 1 FlgK
VKDETFTITTDTDGDPTANLPSAWHWTLESFKDRFNGLATNVTASVTSDYALKFSPDAGYGFGFSDQNFDVSGLLAALGINTFFEGSSARSIGTNPQIENKDFIAAGKINNNVGFAVAADTNTSTGTITTSGPYSPPAGETSDATYTITITNGGTQFTWSKSDSSSGVATNISIGSLQTIDDGVTLIFNPGTYADNDTFTIEVTASSNPSRLLAKGNNTNALLIADLQFDSRNIEQWTTSRGSTANSSANSAATLEDYYHSMVGSIGIKSASITRIRAFNEAIANKLGVIRDSISAVSLDEEMTNLIKFQSAYAAAAKLIKVADEMLNTLLAVK